MPPLVTDINLSLDDRFLYVSCWGTGELKQFDVSDPFNPVETGSVKIGGIVRRQAAPGASGQPLNGAPQMVEISRDGRRVYVTNSLYRTWDEQFYPDGIRGLAGQDGCDADGGMTLDPRVSSSSTACGRTRCTWRAATPARIPTASREVMMTTERTTSWAMLVVLGAFHGINPRHGLAVRGGARDAGAPPRRRRPGARCRSVLGHALAVAAAVAEHASLGKVVPLGVCAGVAGVARGAWRAAAYSVIAIRAGRGMRVGMRGLTLWSFLMASAHGAGLMVVPVFVGMTMAGVSTPTPACQAEMPGPRWSATGLHAAGYLVVTAVVALVVFEKLGVGLLRRAWFNLDLIWASALVVTGALTMSA